VKSGAYAPRDAAYSASAAECRSKRRGIQQQAYAQQRCEVYHAQQRDAFHEARRDIIRNTIIITLVYAMRVAIAGVVDEYSSDHIIATRASKMRVIVARHVVDIYVMPLHAAYAHVLLSRAIAAAMLTRYFAAEMPSLTYADTLISITPRHCLLLFCHAPPLLRDGATPYACLH